jgi:hypothetical protein
MKLPPQVASVPRSASDPSPSGDRSNGGAAPSGHCQVGYQSCSDGTNQWCCQNSQTCGSSPGTCNS